MPKFITFFSYSGPAAKAMIEHPSDRSAAVKVMIESLGGTLESFYWMTGEHDGFAISDLPDGLTGAAVSLAVGATGAVTGVESHLIYDHDDQADIVTKAAAALQAYKPPTA